MTRNAGMLLLAVFLTLIVWLGLASAIEVFVTIGGWLAEHTLIAYPALSCVTMFAFCCYVTALAIWAGQKTRRLARIVR